MFISGQRDTNTSFRGSFLILATADGDTGSCLDRTRAFVRYVRLSQSGHFMSGFTDIGGERVYLSGSYGSDGLPTTLPRAAWEQGILVPRALMDAWNAGGGWNGAGSEAGDMRAWVAANLPALRRAGRDRE